MTRWMTTDERAFFDTNGYAVIQGLYTRQETEKMKQELDKIWLDGIVAGSIVQQPKRPLDSLFPPLRDVHLTSEYLLGVMTDPRQFDLVEQIIGEEALAIGTGCFFKPPGAAALPFHQDNYDIGVYPGTTCAVWISLDDTDPDNGGLRFVPGTQHLGLLPPKIPGHASVYGQAVPVPRGYEVAHVRTRQGDAVVFGGNILHGSNPNVTKHRFRRAFVTHFAGAGTEKIMVHHLDLRNRHGELMQRRMNRYHKLQFIDEYQRRK